MIRIFDISFVLMVVSFCIVQILGQEDSPFLNSSGTFTIRDNKSGHFEFAVDAAYFTSIEGVLKVHVYLAAIAGKLRLTHNDVHYTWKKCS